jgi:rhamnogalacturonan endolyase
MIVYDFDGNGKAEVALKTAEGDYRNAESNRVLTGPEYCSVWNGETGAEIAKADWIERGKPDDWGDTVGNRMNRHMMGLAYLDGKTPAILVLRGIYGLMKMDAWLLQDGQLQKAWRWTNEMAGWKYQGQGQHSIHVADIDGDGFDEILNGSIAVDQDGRTMWSTGLGHGDRFYISDIDPDRPGLEIWYSYEDPHPQNGVSLWDARTGDLIFGTRDETGDDQVDRALAADIDPNYPGMECWATDFYFSSQGEPIPGDIPPLDGMVWWDADLLREIETEGQVSKWQGEVLTTNIEGNVQIWADLFGDWREEIATYHEGEIRIYTTTIPAADRRVCLTQDPLYRADVALKAMGYDQVPMTSYYLGTETVTKTSSR